MAAIPERYLDQLRAAGLDLPDWRFVPNHVAFPDGVCVSWNPPEPDDPPVSMWFHSNGKKWIVTVHDYIPGPGAGDFRNEWDTPEEAVADILEFFFGDQTRMNVKREAWAHRWRPE